MYEIIGIRKPDRDNYWERITHVCVFDFESEKVERLDQEEVIKLIEDDEITFFVDVDGDRVEVIVATSRFGNKYIKTETDGDEPNNLLSLPEC